MYFYLLLDNTKLEMKIKLYGAWNWYRSLCLLIYIYTILFRPPMNICMCVCLCMCVRGACVCMCVCA